MKKELIFCRRWASASSSGSGRGDVAMSPLKFGLQHPITVIVGMLGVALGGIAGAVKMQRDVFPDLNMPVIYVAQAYGGMDSAQMEGLITSYYEMVFLYMNGIDHVESKNIQNLALVKLYFHPGTDMVQAMAEAAIYANRVKAYFPPGTVPPFIMRMDASCVPVSFLVLSSETRSISELSDLMLFRVRPNLANIRGRHGAATVRRQPADHHRLSRSRAAARLQSCRRKKWPRCLEQAAIRSRRRATLGCLDKNADRIDQFARASIRRIWAAFRSSLGKSNRSICATWAGLKTKLGHRHRFRARQRPALDLLADLVKTSPIRFDGRPSSTALKDESGAYASQCCPRMLN